MSCDIAKTILNDLESTIQLLVSASGKVEKTKGQLRELDLDVYSNVDFGNAMAMIADSIDSVEELQESIRREMT